MIPMKNTERPFKTIYVDIDETICFYPEEYSLDDKKDYSTAIPNYEFIKKVNSLYDAGHRIVYWTARGSRSKVNWLAFTARQLKEWAVKYHQLRCDKPYYDTFIEDRSIRIEEL
jgi:hypothetical protein